MKSYIYIIGIILTFHSCVPSEQEVVIEQPTDKPLAFSARKNAIITRAGTTGTFDDGTVYDLYALDAAAYPNYWANAHRVLYANQGEEDGGYITYTLDPGQQPYFNNRTLDFYGVSWGTTADPVEITSATDPAKYAISVNAANDSLPDLLRAYTPNLGCKKSNYL